VESELRQILEAVSATAPATRAEIGDAVEQQGATFSARAVDEAIRSGLIFPFDETAEAVGASERRARIVVDEAYALTPEGEMALAEAAPPEAG
jgi:hypothetical protein